LTGNAAYNIGMPTVIIERNAASFKILKMPGNMLWKIFFILLNILLSIPSYTSNGK